MKHRRKKPRRKQSKNVSYASYQPRAGGNGKHREKSKYESLGWDMTLADYCRYKSGY